MRAILFADVAPSGTAYGSGAVIPKTYAELTAMSDEDLIAAFDQEAVHIRLGMDFLRDELLRREVARSAKVMTRLTWWIAVLTVINVVLVAWSIID